MALSCTLLLRALGRIPAERVRLLAERVVKIRRAVAVEQDHARRADRESRVLEAQVAVYPVLLVQPGDVVDKLGEQYEAIRLLDVLHSVRRKLRLGVAISH